MFNYREAFLCGIETYDHYTPLPCVRGDIAGVGRRVGLETLLTQQLGKHSYKPVHTICGEYNSENLHRQLKTKIDALRESDKNNEHTLFFLYFSAHGVTNPNYDQEDRFIIAASNTEANYPALGIHFSWLLKKVKPLKAAVVCVIDCCYSGSAIVGAQHYLEEKQNIAVFAACAPDEESYFTQDRSQSRFTSFLIDVLQGNEPFALDRRELTTHSLEAFLKTRFPDALQTPLCWIGQTPILLARPHCPIPVRVRVQNDHIHTAFDEYIKGRLQEYHDSPELTSEQFFIQNACQRFVFQGSPRKKVSEQEVYRLRTIEVLREWIEAPGKPMHLVMGDTGVGKTTALRRFWYMQANAWLAGQSKYIPLLIGLKRFGGVRLVEIPDQGNDAKRRFRAVLLDILQNQEGLQLYWSTFMDLCRDGRILLILDGLDEMDTDGLPGAAAANLGLLMSLFAPGGKMIISCRAHYLRSDNELLGILATSVPESIPIQHLELMPFDEKQIVAYLGPRITDAQLRKWHDIRQTDKLGLMELYKRPFLLAELADHFDEVIEPNQNLIRPSKLFYWYLRTWLRRDDWRFRRFFHDFRDAVERDRARLGLGESTNRTPVVSDLRFWEHRVLAVFIELLAADLWTTDTLSVSAENIPTRIRAHLPLAPDVFVSFFDYAIRTCSFLTRKSGDVYSFLDNSVLEYFAIRKFHDDILNTEYPWDCSRDRGGNPVQRIPLELGCRPLTARMADTLADSLLEDSLGARKRLAEIIRTTDERVKNSPETLYYLGGNCLSVYARLNGHIIPSGFDLREKWLSGAILSECNLTNVNLSGSLLEGVDLQRANLRNASIDGAQLYHCRLKDANFEGIRINGGRNAIVVPSDDFDPLTCGSPELMEVVRLSKGSERRSFVRPSRPLGQMNFIPGGVFLMGTNSPRAQPYERPARRIKVKPFYMDVQPVTNAEFAEFVTANPEWRKDAVIDRLGIPYYLCYWQGIDPPVQKEHHPVVYVNWYAAEAYAAWVGKRLPTEAEWEFALRDGNHAECWDYPYGPGPVTGIDPHIRQQFNIVSEEPAQHRTLPLTKPVDPGRTLRMYHLIDMTGNVNEWVQDWFADKHDYFDTMLKELRRRDPPYLEDYKGPDSGSRKVIRGGSYLFDSDINWMPFTTYYRRPLPPINTNQDCGFRCALGVEGYNKRQRASA